MLVLLRYKGNHVRAVSMCPHLRLIRLFQKLLTIHNEQATDGRHHQQMDGYDSGLTGDKQIREQWMQADQGWSAACTIHTYQCSL